MLALLVRLRLLGFHSVSQSSATPLVSGTSSPPRPACCAPRSLLRLGGRAALHIISSWLLEKFSHRLLGKKNTRSSNFSIFPCRPFTIMDPYPNPTQLFESRSNPTRTEPYIWYANRFDWLKESEMKHCGWEIDSSCGSTLTVVVSGIRWRCNVHYPSCCILNPTL